MAARKKTAKPEIEFDAMPGINTESFKEGFEKMNKSFETFAELNKESVETAISASQKVASNVEQFSTEQAAFAKASFEDGVKAVQTVATAKSPQEALDLNAQYFRTTLENNMAQMNKIGETFVATSKEAFEPMTDSYNKFLEAVQSYRP